MSWVKAIRSEYSSCPEGHYDLGNEAGVADLHEIGILLLPGRALRRLASRHTHACQSLIGILLLPGRALRQIGIRENAIQAINDRNTPPARKGITTAEGAQAVINWLKSYGIYLVRREMLTSPMHATASKETAR